MQRFLFESGRFSEQTCVRTMILFYCPECGEELEAEDAIKGSRMKCPACWKEIMVPRVGAPAPSRREPRRNFEDRPESSSGWVPILLVAFLSLSAIGGVIGYMAMQKQGYVEADLCTACEGSGNEICGDCQGSKSFPCDGRCKGSGTVKSLVGGEETSCPDCGGLGTKSCSRCDGYGHIGCAGCQGTGKAAGEGD
ncbi:MAG: hypothetical protein QF645_06565 [Planctomycetota bacterium]|nr:hypothetical protein [Planctomycetota bacterium]